MASQALRSIRQLPARPAARAASQAALRAPQQLQSTQSLLHSERYAGTARCLASRTFARQQSTSQKPRSQPPKPGQVPSVGAILRKGLDFRPAFSFFGRGGLRKLFRQNPGELVLALIILTGLGGIGAYTVYLYFAYFNDTQFTKFPPDVANSLRRALYYTNIKPDPKLAVKYYRRAIEQCGDHGMDPYSDEVLGIRIQTAAWLEKIGNFDGAITVLGGVVKDILRWVDWMEKGIEDGSLPKSGKVPIPKRVEEGGEKEGQAVAKVASAEGQTGGEQEQEQEQEYLPENLWRKRTRLLAKAVGTSTKLGELNASEYVLQPDESQYRLTWAVETALKELKRRHDEGEKEDEGPWLSAPEIGGALESLASNYESRSQFQLVVPLLFHALRLCESPCHRPVLMNNIASAFAQHPAGDVLTVIPQQSPNIPAQNQPPPEAATREQLLQFAHNWATNAYTHAVDVKGDDRTEECDEACAVALCNLGDISLMLKRPAEARAHFERCVKMSKDLGFADGVKQAKAGLARVKAESS